MNRDELLTKLAMKLDEWPLSTEDELPSGWVFKGPYVGVWGESSADSLFSERQWLLRRAELINKPDWSDAPEWAEWLAQDGDGRWEWHEDMPVEMAGGWDIPDNERFHKWEECAKGAAPAGHDWRQTLEQRHAASSIGASSTACDDQFASDPGADDDHETLTFHPLDDGSKPTNPKDAIGSGKIPMHLWPNTASAMGSIGLLNGMLKYGRANFRAIGIRSSIYYDAARRHLDAWFEGEECDPDDGVPHLAAALACLAIIVDAQAAGKLNDDRQFAGGYRDLMEELTPHVGRLKDLHATKDPHHYTIADGG